MTFHHVRNIAVVGLHDNLLQPPLYLHRF